MKTVWFACVVFLTTAGLGAEPTPSAETYGDAAVSAVLGLDETITLYCDIPDFPAIIGKNMPVQIKGLKIASQAQDNTQLLAFLNEFFFSKNVKPRKIVLKNIQRGERFCLLADIEADGQNLGDLLVEKKLAQKIIEIPSRINGSSNTSSANTTSLNSDSVLISASSSYIASKTSKVFHRSDCPHAKRLDASKTIAFSNRQDAAATGRRPCKTCNP